MTFAVAYLVACMATLAVALGMLVLLLIAPLSGAVWFIVFRRRAEEVVGALPALAVLSVPLVMAPHAFGLAPPPFAPARALAYWAVWLWLGEAVRRGPSLRICVVGLAATALAIHFAVVDWMMSASSGWSSSVYSAYYFAGAMVSALALLAALPARGANTNHVQALGRLMLAFVLFWAYLWYVQFFIIWIADIPREASWYVVRLGGAWGVVAKTLIVAGFVLPFIVLLFHAARGSAWVMSAVGAWLLAAHCLDVYWVLAPSARVRWSVLDILWDAAALALVAGSATAVAMWRRARMPAAATEDPLLPLAMRYEAH
jgi:hypothetical protein